MFRHTMLLMVIAATLATCMGQMGGGMGGMGAMIEGMAGSGGLASLMGGQGGLASLFGGQGGLGALMGGQGGIGGFASMLNGLGGMGGMGGMITSMITPMVNNAAMTAKVNDMVRVVLGPNARANQMMIQYAKKQQSMPTTVVEMFPYFEMLTNLSKMTGILMPDGRIKRPATPGTKQYSGQPSMSEVMNLVIKRGTMWLDSQKVASEGNANSLAQTINSGAWY